MLNELFSFMTQLPEMQNLSLNNEKLLRELITKYDLSVAEDTIVSHAAECSVIILGDTETYSDVGNSRYGGVPDLPSSIHWPQSNQGYLGFLMQVNLAELPEIANSPLPSLGILYFFIEEDEACTEVTARIIFYNGDVSSLQRINPPPIDQFTPVVQGNYSRLEPHLLHLRIGIDLPSYGSKIYEQVDELAEVTDAGDGGERYFNLIDDAIGKSDDCSIVGQILGFPSEINGDMCKNAYLVHAGHRDKIYDYEYREACKDELSKAVNEWKLLWRIDSSTLVNVCIWDAGSYFIMISKKDLATLNFQNIYTEIETG
jgi:uncharacterized protein YwqG